MVYKKLSTDENVCLKWNAACFLGTFLGGGGWIESALLSAITRPPLRAKARTQLLQ